MNELYDPAKQAVFTIAENGHEYDSGFEARAGEYMRVKLGMQFTYINSLAFLMRTLGGQYKADYGMVMPDGSLSVVETKGWVTKRVKHIMGLMKDKVDNPADRVSKYSVVWTKGIEVYDGTTADYVPGAFYVCPNCGKAWILPKENHVCPECETRCDYDRCDVNNAFNEWWKETAWGPVWEAWLPVYAAQQEQIQKSEELNKRYVKYLMKNYPGLDLRHQTTKDKDLVFLTRFAFYGSYIPDFYYTEPRHNVVRFGTALEPLAIVIVDDYPSNHRQHLLNQMLYFVNNRGCPVVKVVHIDHLGIHVCDRHNPNSFVDGAIYRCDKCGKEYFGAKDHRECPCCDSANTTKLSK